MTSSNEFVPETKEIEGLWSYCREVLWKPWWALLTEGILFVGLSWATWVRDNLTSEETQKRFATLRFLPHWHWQTWLLLFLASAVALLLKNSYRLWATENAKVKILLSSVRAPELIIVYEDDESVHKGGTIVFHKDVVVENLSKNRNAYNIRVKDLVTPEGTVTFIPQVIPSIPSGGSGQVTPNVGNEEPFYRQNLAHLFQKPYRGFGRMNDQSSHWITLEYEDDAGRRFEGKYELIFRPYHDIIRTGRMTRRPILSIE